MKTRPLATVAQQQQFCDMIARKYVHINHLDALAALDWVLYGTIPTVHYRLCEVVLKEYRSKFFPTTN